jgi:acetoin utilization deacetylase AcuC-like enzyme
VIPIVWSEEHRLHDPRAEIWVGVRTPAVAVAARADAIRAELEAAGHPLVAAVPQPDAAIAAVHDAALLEFLATAWERWEACGLTRDPGQDRVVPYFFPHPGLPRRRTAPCCARSACSASSGRSTSPSRS